MKYITIKDLWGVSSEEKLVYLKEQWELVDDCVYGQIEEKLTGTGSKFYTLTSVKNINGKMLEYPFNAEMIKYITKKISDFGIFLGRKGKLHSGCLVRAQIIISEQRECEKANNPLSVAVQSLAAISTVPNSFVKKDEDGNVLIEKSLKEYLIKTKLSDIDNTIHKSKVELSHFKTQLAKKNEELKEVNDQILDTDDKRQIIKKNLQNEKNELHKIKNECKRDKQKEISRLNKTKEETMKKMDQLKEYVQSKADFLRDLELISQDQYNYVTGKTVQKLDNEEKQLDFEKDLNKDFGQLISQIQYYLYSV